MLIADFNEPQTPPENKKGGNPQENPLCFSTLNPKPQRTADGPSMTWVKAVAKEMPQSRVVLRMRWGSSRCKAL